ncbi:branched-chain amino acid ABC transporter permease [Nocardioides sp.]|uniref:branched-chain amino acid ABC transporter permease n=1 Tax=Nocardioides sp. TaxID=35761 RepID=UPI0039E2B119
MYAAIINGLLIGGFYALVALGLSIVFGVLKLINLAHGELIVAGAYLAYLLALHAHLGLWAVLPIAALAVGIVAYLLQRGLLTGLLLRGQEGALVATFGLSLLAQGLFTQWFSSAPRSMSSSLATSGVNLFGVQTRLAYLVTFVVALVLCGAAHLVLAHTRVGAVVHAAATDPATSQLVGIDVRRVYALTFAIAAAAAAASGALLAINFSFTPTTGSAYLLIGIAVVVIGGVGNVAGTVVGALLLGVVQSVAVEMFGGGYRDLAVYLVFFLVLTARPQGLLSRSRAA